MLPGSHMGHGLTCEQLDQQFAAQAAQAEGNAKTAVALDPAIVQIGAGPAFHNQPHTSGGGGRSRMLGSFFDEEAEHEPPATQRLSELDARLEEDEDNDDEDNGLRPPLYARAGPRWTPADPTPAAGWPLLSGPQRTGRPLFAAMASPASEERQSINSTEALDALDARLEGDDEDARRLVEGGARLPLYARSTMGAMFGTEGGDEGWSEDRALYRRQEFEPTRPQAACCITKGVPHRGDGPSTEALTYD